METTSPSENRQPLLRISNLRFGYDDDALFENFSLDIPAQSITALVGPNGAGKSTLLHCITGFLRPFAGEIRLAETPIFNDIENARRQMGYLSDDFGLYDQLTARQNMASIATAHGKRRQPNPLSRRRRQPQRPTRTLPEHPVTRATATARHRHGHPPLAAAAAARRTGVGP